VDQALPVWQHALKSGASRPSGQGRVFAPADMRAPVRKDPPAEETGVQTNRDRDLSCATGRPFRQGQGAS
jgi:hypothetical protein